MLCVKIICGSVLAVLTAGLPAVAAGDSPCPEAWHALLIRPQEPLDWNQRALGGFARMPAPQTNRIMRNIRNISQFIPRQILMRTIGKPWDFIPFERAVELLLQAPLGAATERTLGKAYELGSLPKWAAASALASGTAYATITLPAQYFQSKHLDNLIADSFPYAEIKERLEKRQISESQARNWAKNLESALADFYSLVAEENFSNQSFAEQKIALDSARTKLLFEDIPDLLRRENLLQSDKLAGIPGFSGGNPEKQTEDLYAIQAQLLLKYGIIPDLVSDLRKNQETLKAPERYFNFAANHGDLKLNPDLEKILQSANGREIVEELVRSPLTRALLQLKIRGEELEDGELAYAMMKDAYFLARLSSLLTVGAGIVKSRNADGSVAGFYALGDFERGIVLETRARADERIKQKKAPIGDYSPFGAP